jgi:6-phosphogluconate dehydrogenase
MRDYLGLTDDEMHEVFEGWRSSDLSSYLIDITADILAYKDEDGEPLVEKILDTAGQKGTGKWTAVAALDEGVPLTLIGEAVFARCLSAQKEERVEASKILGSEITRFVGTDEEKKAFINSISRALLASKVVSYAQGYMLMRAAAESYGWHLNYGGIALMWRGGCIIRSVFLGRIYDAYKADPELTNLLTTPYFRELMAGLIPDWRRVVGACVAAGLPTPAFSSALAYYDGYRCPRLPANLLQAQRDYFGAHTYERVDAPRGEFFHTNWTGRGGTTSAGTYNA